jgi:hypothetical protein
MLRKSVKVWAEFIRLKIGTSEEGTFMNTVTKMAVFWVVAPFSLTMEAASTTETLVSCYQTIRRNN